MFDSPDFSYVVLEVRPSGMSLVEVVIPASRSYRKKGDVALLRLRPA